MGLVDLVEVIPQGGDVNQTIGHGKPFILLHGWVNSWQVWRESMFRIAGAGDFKVYALDFWGFGESSRRQGEDVDYDIIGNLDADISFEPDYMKCLIEKFERDPELGVGGTDYVEGEFHSFRDSYISENHVNGQIQMFRKNCFDEIGGYLPIPYGGIDLVAVMMARMKGYRTRSFQDRVYNHLRKMGTEGTNVLGSRFHYGKKDYFLGGHPLWQIFRCTFQMTKKPYGIGGMALLAGYGWAWITMKKQVPKDLERFHRMEQMNRLKNIFKSGLRMRG